MKKEFIGNVFKLMIHEKYSWNFNVLRNFVVTVVLVISR